MPTTQVPDSLRQAITDVCAGGTVTFSGDTSIYLNSRLLLAKGLTIDGGVYTVKISGDSGNDGSRNVQVFNVTTGTTVTLSHLNIVSGTAGSGGGLYNAGVLLLQNSNLSSNTDYLWRWLVQCGKIAVAE